MSGVAVETVRIGTRPTLAADVAGEGALVVFLHGVGGGRRNWKTQVPHVGRRARAVALDLRGYGDSEDYETPLAFTDFADDVIRVADHFGADQIHLCGLSMGGRVALDCYRRYPARVASMVLADTSAGSAETQDPARIEAFLEARRKPLLDGKTPAQLAPQLIGALAGPGATEEQRAELIDSLSRLHRDSYIQTLEVVTRFNDFPELSSIAVPVQVVVGGRDHIAPPHLSREMAKAIPAARLDIVPGAGHISNLERPDVFNAILDRFYDEVL